MTATNIEPHRKYMLAYIPQVAHKGSSARATRPAKEIKTMTEFEVTLRFQFPAWDERDGLRYFVHAKTKADAVRYARSDARRDGHLGTGKGHASFSAVAI